MRPTSLHLLPLALIAGLSSVAACSPAADNTEVSNSSDLTSFVPRVGPREFRDDFFTYVSRNGVSEAAAKKLVYLAPPSVAEAGGVQPSTAENPLAPLDDFYSRVHASTLYDYGASQPIRRVENIESTFAASGPIHVILVPGIFGEFIDSRPFEELLSKTDSTAARKWKSIADATRNTPAGTVQGYSVAKLADEPLPIDETIDVASIDDATGKPLVTLAFLKPRTGSLETLGSLEDSTNTYLPRIDRYASLMGRPRNVVVMGYSRGTPVALDVVAKAAKDRNAHPWVDDVVGVSGLAGVIYGTALADSTKDPNNVTGKMLREIQGLATNLHSCSPDKPFATAALHRTQNTAMWASTIAKVAWLASKLPAHPEIEAEQISSATPDYGRLGKLVQRIAFNDTMNLDRPFSDYCANVERFKKTIDMAIRGVDSLTTESRLGWWRTNVLPPHVRLFSVTATMGDATRDGQMWPLTTDETVNDPRSIDFKSLRGNFYDLFAASGIDLNDSQVTFPRARFWASAHPILNPEQAPVRAYFMGTLGTHHWGLAFPRAFATQDGLTGNPFPRTELMAAMGTFISQAIVSERNPQ